MMKLPRISPGSRWLILPPVALGIAAVAYALNQRATLEPAVIVETSRTLRVIPVPELELIPRVLGYGTAQPVKIWEAVAEVQGNVTEVHPELRGGALIDAGTILLWIDRTEYELALRQLRANEQQTTVELSLLDVREQNLRDALQIEERAVELAEAEVQRIQDLVDSNAASRASLDMTRRELLRHQQSLQTQQSSLNLIPSQRDSLAAMLDAQQAGIEDAERNLAKTALTAPFDCRIGDVNIDAGQFISLGQRLFEADGTAATEIVAQIAVDKSRTLVNPGDYDMADVLSVLASRDPNQIRDLFQIDVKVRASAGNLDTFWDARFVTTSGEVDPRTRTVGFITVVDRPYEQIIIGERPPLIRGVFCEVELRGRPLAARILIPRLAIHNDSVYVVDQEHRLERRPVEVEFVQSNLAVIASGLNAGEMLVVSDPTPAIEGQLVTPVTDDELLDSIRGQAAGEQPLR